jgi:hypothetical protein
VFGFLLSLDAASGGCDPAGSTGAPDNVITLYTTSS